MSLDVITPLGKRELADLVSWREDLRNKNKKLVTTNGCFDILHSGHITYLEQARGLGDALVVGLNSDVSVRAIKGPGRPFNSQEDRAKVLLAMRCVDAVIIFDEQIPLEFVDVMKPDIHCKAGDYSESSMPEAKIVRSHGGDIQLLPYVTGKSTSRLVKEILSSTTSLASELSIPADVHTQLMDFSNLIRQTAYQSTIEIQDALNLIFKTITANHQVFVCGIDDACAKVKNFVSRLALPNVTFLEYPTNGTIEYFSGVIKSGDLIVVIFNQFDSGIQNFISAVKENRVEVIGLSGTPMVYEDKLFDIHVLIPAQSNFSINMVESLILDIICEKLKLAFGTAM